MLWKSFDRRCSGNQATIIQQTIFEITLKGEKRVRLVPRDLKKNTAATSLNHARLGTGEPGNPEPPGMDS